MIKFLRKHIVFSSIALVVLIFSVAYLFDVFDQHESDYQIISREEFKKRIKEGHPIIDVRRPDEFVEGSIPNAINVNVLDPNFRQKIDTLDKTKLHLIHCRSGNRSKKAAEIMIDLGFEKIYDLKGGYLNWISSDSLQ
ncbi:MAG: rhodanese-like domain-containing protein [Flavobacteriaceae bacterium]|nr:rhodanese-like domain-containing protein [Flavobacteriaceae bacterium]MCY4298707.1 rhodanese-like domain-containing protein [Flavobacteriaceae bacterium]